MNHSEEVASSEVARPAGYFGHRQSGKAQVFRRIKAGNQTGPQLQPRLDVRSYSPGGLEWGYLGSGPNQLSLALLVDYLGDVAQAEDLHQDFKNAVVIYLPEKEWTLSNEDIADALAVIRAEHALKAENAPSE